MQSYLDLDFLDKCMKNMSQRSASFFARRASGDILLKQRNQWILPKENFYRPAYAFAMKNYRPSRIRRNFKTLN